MQVRLLLNPATRDKLTLSSGDPTALLKAHLPLATAMPADLAVAAAPQTASRRQPRVATAAARCRGAAAAESLRLRARRGLALVLIL